MGIDVIRDSSGRMVFTTRRSTGKMRSMYQFMASGSDSRRRVSAVGAQSTTSRSYRPESTWVFTSVRAKISSSPGITDSSSASMASTPAQFRNATTNSWMSRQFVLEAFLGVDLLGPQVRARSPGPATRAGTSNESASECAGSVLMTSVRCPAAAERTAVAAATVVLPTPPLPVNSRMRTVG